MGVYPPTNAPPLAPPLQATRLLLKNTVDLDYMQKSGGMYGGREWIGSCVGGAVLLLPYMVACAPASAEAVLSRSHPR